MDETAAQKRLRVFQTIRALTGDNEERDALDRALQDEFGVGLAFARQSSQFESFHVIVLDADGAIIDRNDAPVDAILFNTATEFSAAVAGAEADHPGSWVEGIGIMHGGKPWCLVRPLNRPMNAGAVLETVMDELAASTRTEPVADIETPRPSFSV